MDMPENLETTTRINQKNIPIGCFSIYYSYVFKPIRIYVSEFKIRTIQPTMFPCKERAVWITVKRKLKIYRSLIG